MRRRDAQAFRRWSARLRRERLRLGRPLAAAQERGYVGALILDPVMISPMARLRPPGWFTDPTALEIMRALFCLQHRTALRLDDVAEVLQRHGTLNTVGGPSALQALLRPGPFLEVARADLRAERSSLPPVDADWRVQLANGLLGGVSVPREESASVD